MEKNLSLSKKKQWKSLLGYVSLKFGDGKELDLQAILFLIGVNELGQGYRDFTKEEKVNLLHIAICKLLNRYGYYDFLGRDKDGWPHWKTNSGLSPLHADQQTVLLKESAVLYFLEAGIKL